MKTEHDILGTADDANSAEHANTLQHQSKRSPSPRWGEGRGEVLLPSPRLPSPIGWEPVPQAVEGKWQAPLSANSAFCIHHSPSDDLAVTAAITVQARQRLS
jgi:hypothetical protein